MKDIELTEKLRSKFVEFELDVDFSDKGLDNLAEACASICKSYAEDKVKELQEHIKVLNATIDNQHKLMVNAKDRGLQKSIEELTLKNAEIHGGYIHELDSLRVDNSKLNDKVKELQEHISTYVYRPHFKCKYCNKVTF